MMLFLSLSSLAMGIEDIIIQIPVNGYNPPDSKEVVPLNAGLRIGLNLMNRLNYVIGDIVVVWRAWVLFPQKLAVKVTLSICLLGSFDTVGTSLDMALLAKGISENTSFNGNMAETIILTVPLISTNLTATTLIGFKARGSPDKIGDLVLGLRQDSHSTANSAYHTTISGLVAIYPILIILAVAHENNKSESVNDVSLSQSIRFASVQTSKSEDHHPESGRESQLAFPVASINNNVEVEGNEIDIVPRLS
ncbi:hypothetical protein K435DRAFT_802464 [Dendrothele bispora CBS 962.96]|uniref:Uncharacterized protein n=1 Tax=Dendrothele bispora (strain CBS 962.96) TaxID=1314807 RepID=A0A4S8LKM9_DENBC|nr:hypothetical protein K435DRAFT_802464 [Dendrothele bispora CBS 962.96]